jgi:hypothetical protein
MQYLQNNINFRIRGDHNINTYINLNKFTFEFVEASTHLNITIIILSPFSGGTYSIGSNRQN